MLARLAILAHVARPARTDRSGTESAGGSR
jgi:hypothetical protein